MRTHRMATETSAPTRDLLHFERLLWDQGQRRLAGVDEAGRGPLAGPVVAAAVIFRRAFIEAESATRFAALTDSKQLTAAQRERFFELLTTAAAPDVEIGVGFGDVPEIDRVNILRATHAAMRRALNALPAPPDHALIDGLPVPDLPCPSTAIVQGDARSLSIAAASVIAKVTRDRWMTALDRRHPQYGFARHKGYGTAAHLQALLRHGPTAQHRRSFRPVRDVADIRQRQADAAPSKPCPDAG